MQFTAKVRIPLPNFGLCQQQNTRLSIRMDILACRTALKGPTFRPTTRPIELCQLPTRRPEKTEKDP
ncbi:hypothetical protein PspLS_00321 [Pyricularia sp. CBS 133598]|nr:hypothetical protein PspLS_00321 [Pyricularia sp. CBS 133598]